MAASARMVRNGPILVKGALQLGLYLPPSNTANSPTANVFERPSVTNFIGVVPLLPATPRPVLVCGTNIPRMASRPGRTLGRFLFQSWAKKYVTGPVSTPLQPAYDVRRQLILGL